MAQHKKHKIFGQFFEWFGIGHGLHAVLASELIRTVVLPAVMTLATGTAGVLGGIPIMWIIMASCVVFGSVSGGFLMTTFMAIEEHRKISFVSTELSLIATWFHWLIRIGGKNAQPVLQSVAARKTSYIR